MKIAFIGLGNMGGPMAANLARAKHDLTVFDLDQTKIGQLLALGATQAASLADCVRGADVVMTSLPSPAIIEKIGLGPEGIIGQMKPGSTWIELSTNNLEICRKIAIGAENAGIGFLDSPISGGTEGAAAGTLLIMVGGDVAVFAAHEPLLKVIGSRVLHMGAQGAGYVAKISQVVLCYLNSVALSEALMLGVKGGVDPDLMLAIIQDSTGASYVAKRYGPAILDGSYDEGFALGLAHKDMALTLELAQSVNAQLPMCESVEDIYRRAVSKFGFDQNHLMAVKLLEDDNQMPLRSNVRTSSQTPA